MITLSAVSSGENESGKTSLMARLQGIEDPRRGYGLEYQYIDVKDEYRDGAYLEAMLLAPPL